MGNNRTRNAFAWAALMLALVLLFTAPVALAQDQPEPPAAESQAAAQDATEQAGSEQSPPVKSDAAETRKKSESAKGMGGLKALRSMDVVPPDIQTKDDFDQDMPAPRMDSPTISVMRVILSLLLVIALIIGTVYVLKYFYSRSMRLDLKATHIRVLDTVQLGMNRAVFMVKVGEMVILLGTGDKGLVYLTEVTDAVNMEDLIDEPEGRGDFSSQIKSAVGPRNKNPQSGDKLTQFNSRLRDKLKKLDNDQDPQP
jgi:flagellar biogenesis protein FliO